MRQDEQYNRVLRHAGVMIEHPTDAEDIVFFRTPEKIIIVKIAGETDDGTVSFKLEYRPDGTAFGSGTEIHATALAADEDGQEQESGFSNRIIPRESVIALVSSATTGTPSRLIARIEYILVN